MAAKKINLDQTIPGWDKEDEAICDRIFNIRKEVMVTGDFGGPSQAPLTIGGPAHRRRVRKAGYNADEPRNEQGEWTSGSVGTDEQGQKFAENSQVTERLHRMVGDKNLDYTLQHGFRSSSDGNWGPGVYFLMGDNTALSIAQGGGGTSVDGYINVKNLYEYPAYEDASIADCAVKAGVYDRAKELGKGGSATNDSLRQAFQEKGYDGLRIINGHSYNHGWKKSDKDWIVVFDAKKTMVTGKTRSKVRKAGYNPDEPRDEAGQWTYGGVGFTGDVGVSYDGNQDQRRQMEQEFVGQQLTERDYIRLSGAPDGSELKIVTTNNKIMLKYYNEEFELSATRFITREGLLNEHLFIEANDAPQYLGTRILAREVEMARELGINEISLLAAGNGFDSGRMKQMNGYYTWARLGFDRRLSRSEADQARAALKIPQPKRDPGFRDERMRVSDIMMHPKGPAYWKEYGTSGVMYFDTDADSDSSMALDAYLHKHGFRVTRKAGFNPDEPRDEKGEWTTGGGGGLSPQRTSSDGSGGRSSRYQPDSTDRAAPYLRNVKSLEDLQTFYEKKYPNIKFGLDARDPNFGRADLETMKATMTEYDRLAKMFPEAASGVTYIGTETPEEMGPLRWLHPQIMNSFAATDTSNGAIYLNPRFYGNPSLARSLREMGIANGTFAEGGEKPSSTMRHEFGHVVMMHLQKDNRAFLPVIDTDGLGERKGTYEAFVRSHPIGHPRGPQKVSRYGGASPEEGWAEGFAQAYGPGFKRPGYVRDLQRFLSVAYRRTYDRPTRYTIGGQRLSEHEETLRMMRKRMGIP